MSRLAASASHTVSKAAADLEAELHSDRGPDARELRQVADDLYTAAGQLLQAAADVETGVET